MIRIFPGKSGRVSFLNLSSFRFIPSFVKILRAVFQISRSHTNQPTTISALGSTEVENCSVLPDLSQLQWLLNFFDLFISSISPQSDVPNLRKWPKTGQIRSFCTKVTSLLNDPDAKYDKYVNQIVNTMLNYQNMQYEVDLMDETWENCQKLVKTGHFVPM